MKRLSRLVIALIAVIFLFGACKSKTKPDVVDDSNVDAVVEYPVLPLPDPLVTDIADDAELFPVSEEFLRDFFVLFDHYQGTPISVRIDVPDEWGVRSIERLPDGKELWLMQSQNREWLYLAITSGSGTQRLLDILPVAVNIVVQNGDVIETETWTTKRDADGFFNVEKTYEWTRSVHNATKEEIDFNPEAYNKKTHVVDQYSINEMGRFSYIEKPVLPDYQAVFFFYDKENKPETWDEVMEITQSFCEEHNIYFEEIYQNYETAFIRDYKMQELIPVDISPYLAENQEGMIMMSNDKEPRTVTFGSIEKLQIELKRYFQLMGN